MQTLLPVETSYGLTDVRGLIMEWQILHKHYLSMKDEVKRSLPSQLSEFFGSAKFDHWQEVETSISEYCNNLRLSLSEYRKLYILCQKSSIDPKFPRAEEKKEKSNMSLMESLDNMRNVQMQLQVLLFKKP